MKTKYTLEEWSEKVAKAKKMPTPGPWYARESENRIYIQSDATPYAIAEINTARITGHNDMVNARLLSASPDLLEHLKRMVNIATHPKATKAAIKIIAQDAMAAIRAATGE